MERSTMLLMGKSTINGTQEKRAPKYSQSPHPRLHPPPCEGWCQRSTARRKPKNSADLRGWADRSYWLEKFWMFPSLAYIHPSEVLGGYGRIFFLLWSDVFFGEGTKDYGEFPSIASSPGPAVGQSGESVTTAVYWPWLLPSGYGWHSYWKWP